MCIYCKVEDTFLSIVLTMSFQHAHVIEEDPRVSIHIYKLSGVNRLLLRTLLILESPA